MIALINDELGGKKITKFVALKPKTYSYLLNSDSVDKKVNGIKKCVKKDLSFKITKAVYLDTKYLTRLHWVLMMIKYYKLLIK